ncbi:major facilitator superfamily (MFS) antibiotic efflux pump [compost metagenome]
MFTLARFSEAFLVLRAQQGGVPIALVPLVMVAMNLVYALSAYPFGKLSDRVNHRSLLALGLTVLLAADLVLATNDHWSVVLVGVALWGMHMGITQGLLATMVADTAPVDL